MDRRPPIVHVRGHRIDLHAHRVLRDDGSPVDLRPQALDLLVELAAAAGEVVDKRVLLERVWPGLVVTDDSLVQAVGDARRAIGDDAHAVIQTVPRRGYRLIAAAPAQDAPAAGTAQPAARDAATPRRRSPWAAAGVLAAAAAALAWWQPWSRSDGLGPHVPDRPPIAVLEFSVDPPGDAAGYGRGLAEELTGELSRNADLRVVAASSSFAAAAQGGDVRAVASRLRAGYLVDGSVRREGDSLRLLVRLVDGRDGTIAWTERRDVPAADIPRVRAELVARIATTLQSSLRRREEALALQRPPASLDVYESSMRGLSLKHRISPDTNRHARELLEQVVARDPGYAPAWAYLGMVDGIDWINQFSGPRRPETLARSLANLERAATLDTRLSAPYLGLSFVLPYAGRQADAVKAGRRCMELAPSDAECMMFLAFALVTVGETQEAVALADRAMALNPLPPSYVLGLNAVAQWAGGRLDAAIAAYDQCLRESPRQIPCRTGRIMATVEAGRTNDALADLAVLRQQGLGMKALEAQATGLYAAAPAAQALVERRRAAMRAVEDAERLASR